MKNFLRTKKLLKCYLLDVNVVSVFCYEIKCLNNYTYVIRKGEKMAKILCLFILFYFLFPYIYRFANLDQQKTWRFKLAKVNFFIWTKKKLISTSWWSDMASVPNRLPSNKVISRVTYSHGLSFRPDNSCYLFLYVDDIKDKD